MTSTFSPLKKKIKRSRKQYLKEHKIGKNISKKRIDRKKSNQNRKKTKSKNKK